MKPCLKCNTPHEKSGKYCCRSCANSRVFSPETIEKKRKKSLEKWSQFDREERKAIHKEKMKLYDFDEHQRTVQKKNLANSWSRPWEEMAHGSARKRLLEETNYTCQKCGTGNNWEGEPLSLELDHIDGNNKNRKRENLRILCPNCHSQTPTHRSKNIKYKKLNKIIPG